MRFHILPPLPPLPRLPRLLFPLVSLLFHSIHSVPLTSLTFPWGYHFPLTLPPLVLSSSYLVLVPFVLTLSQREEQHQHGRCYHNTTKALNVQGTRAPVVLSVLSHDLFTAGPTERTGIILGEQLSPVRLVNDS